MVKDVDSKQQAVVSIVVSYFPMLTDDSRQQIDHSEAEIKKTCDRLKKLQDRYHTKAILWGRNEHKPDHIHPTFVIDDAKAVCNHLLFWSENKPEEWFTLIWDTFHDTGYHLYLVPNVNRSIERHKTALKIIFDIDPIQFKVLFYMHGDTIPKSNTFKREFLEHNMVDVGFVTVEQYCNNTEPTDYITVPCRRLRDLPEEERKMYPNFDEVAGRFEGKSDAPPWILKHHLV